MAVTQRFPWKWLRRGAQIVFLLAFLWLFRKTDYTGGNELHAAVNWLFRLDPLVAAAAMLAARTVVSLLLLALIVVGLTLLLGRVFCGWVCPLGTLLDATHRIATPLPQFHAHRGRWRWVKYFLLGVTLIAACFSVPLVGYFDPFALLVRCLTFAVDPVLNMVVTAPFTWLYQHAPESVSNVSEPIYSFLKNTLLPFHQGTYLLAGLSFGMLLLVFALEWVERRFWCRNLCPLGAMLGLFARFSPLKRRPGRVCEGCGTGVDCAEMCRMDAFDDGHRFSPEGCTLCLECLDTCSTLRPRFAFRGRSSPQAPLDMSRRHLIATVATGLALPAALRTLGGSGFIHRRLIRPPGAPDEAGFLDLCVRCGECMKVCPTNALQPTLLESGIEGMFSPRLVAKIGYCEYNCTLCGQVCPSGAIRALSVEEKQRTIIGKIEFDKQHCLPFAKGVDCIVCEEHCPVPEKAIRFRDVEMTNHLGQRVVAKQPYMVWDLCIGCGICETRCPVPGQLGVRLIRTEYAPKEVPAQPAAAKPA
jgi:polyferredoxin